MKVVIAEQHNLDRPDPLGSHHYLDQFKKAGWDCLWLGPAVSPLHVFKPDPKNRRRFQIWREGKKEIPQLNGIHWLVPFTLLFYYNLPLLKSLYAGRNQYRFAWPPLKKKLENSGFYPVDLLWAAGPAAFSLLDLLPHQVSCYRLADRLDQFSRVPPNVGQLQKELIKKVDFVLATSRYLEDWARQFTEEVYYLPNGVSEIFFEKVSSKPVDFPADNRPVAVYAGTIDTRFDLETLVRAVLSAKEMHFLLIGPLTDKSLEAGLKVLKDEENFTWLGQKAQKEIPAYLQYSNIGLIPFELNPLTEAVNPIKYFEYLASGLPVVAPPLRELTGMEGPLFSYSGEEELITALRDASAVGEAEREGYRFYAHKQRWARRFEEVLQIAGEKVE
ncbi:MAG: glycosyltransferase [Bacillota bacterium]